MNFDELTLSRASWKNDSLLVHLDEKELEYLDEMKEIRHYAKNDIIFGEGKRITGSFIVLSGVIKQYKTGIEGKDRILRLAQPYELIGFRSVLSDEPACNTSKVVENCTLCYIPKECMINLVKTNGHFAFNILQIACRDLAESITLITEYTQKTVKERLAELLLVLKDKFGYDADGNINILLSREDYASTVGTATETIIRLLSEFKSEGYIKISGKRIAIIDENALKKISLQL